MSHSMLNAIAHTSSDRQSFIIHADELTEGDIIRHLGNNWLVISEPEYTCAGITFEVMWLNVATPDNTQSVTFAPQWRFELVAHQSAIAMEAA